MSRNSVLVLVTRNYPFEADGGEIMFVQPEIPYLSHVFDNVLVTPVNPSGRNIDPFMCAKLDLTLAETLISKRKQRICRAIEGLRVRGLWSELPKAFSQGGLAAARRAVAWASLASLTSQWASKRFASCDNILFYTYWRTGVTLGLVEAATRRTGWKVVTRVHGGDLYRERWDPPYQPFSPSLYVRLQRVFAISKAGADYLKSLGVASEQVTIARLGVKDPGFQSQPSTDGVLRLVSCSFLTPVKRVPLLARGILEFAHCYPSLPLQWTHLGDGVDKYQIIRLLKDSPANLVANLPGRLSNLEVWNFYRDNPCDLFVHASASEGVPMAMQEASAVGLPILATNVGGVAEIVRAENGFLLPANPTVHDIVRALVRFLDLSREQRLAMRQAAREVWKCWYDAEKNYSQFASELLNIWRN